MRRSRRHILIVPSSANAQVPASIIVPYDANARNKPPNFITHIKMSRVQKIQSWKVPPGAGREDERELELGYRLANSRNLKGHPDLRFFKVLAYIIEWRVRPVDTKWVQKLIPKVHNSFFSSFLEINFRAGCFHFFGGILLFWHAETVPLYFSR